MPWDAWPWTFVQGSVRNKKLKKVCDKLDFATTFHILLYMIDNKQIQDAVDFLTQANYNRNRQQNPSIAAERWGKVYGEDVAKLLEINYQNKLLTQK